MIEPVEDTMDYSAPSPLPVPNADAGDKVGVVSDAEVGLFPSQGSTGMGEQQGMQSEVREGGVVTTDGWDPQYEGTC